jgi:hypothetical protein
MPLIPVYDSIAKTIYVDNPWDSCGHARFRTIFTLSNPQPATGIPTMGTATDLKGNTVVITATSFTANNEPKSASFNSTFNSIVNGMGTADLTDGNADGIFEAGSATSTVGRNVGTLLIPNFVFFDVNNDGVADYVSMPWTLTNLAAMGFNPNDTCGPAGAGGLEPQIFIPLALGRIILDLDGNGSPDPGVFRSPPLAPQGIPPTNTPTATPTSTLTPTVTATSSPTPVPAAVIVPTLSQRAMVLLAVGLLIAAWFALRRGGLGI